jgi:putative NADH-flavin reductase
MKITVLGATGRTGLPLVSEALRRGHEVKAFCRTPSKLGELESKVTAVQGDILDRSAVIEAVRDADAVVSGLGPVKNSPKEMLQNSVENVVSAMQQLNVRRLVWLTGAGVILEEDEKAFSRTLIRGLMKLVAGSVLADSEAAVEKVRQSELDWTLIRAPMLSEDEATGDLLASYQAPKPKPLPRADVAAFMIEEVERNQWLHKAPMIGRS